VTVTASPRPSTARPPGRPASTPGEVLHRIATLAACVLACMGQAGRSRYESERQLRGWLSDDGVQFTAADIGPALTLLASTGQLVRPETGLGQPRPAWLPTPADAVPALPPRIRLARLIVNCSRPDDKGNRATSELIAERIAAADELVPHLDLQDMLSRLVDCGQLLKVAAGPGYPVGYVSSGSGWEVDAVDLLESDIVACLRKHEDAAFTDEDELLQWLEAEGVTDVDPRAFGLALGHLSRIGRLQTVRPEEWTSKGPRPTWLSEAKVHITR
jgi:hypothetical protein